MSPKGEGMKHVILNLNHQEMMSKVTKHVCDVAPGEMIGEEEAWIEKW